MTFLPIVARELRLAARRLSTYGLRVSASLVVIILGVWGFLAMKSEPPHELAMALFVILTASACLYAWLSGLHSTADCISQEKREGTLGLLFLTDLKGYDVVLGKLTATSIHSLYGLLAILPMASIPLLMGGLAPAEFMRMALAALATLFFSLTLGLCVSAFSRSARKAVGLTFLLLLFFTALIPAIGLTLVTFQKISEHGAFFWFLVPSPVFLYCRALEIFNKSAPSLFWYSLATVFGLSCCQLLLASLAAPRSWQERPAGVRRLRWRERWRLWSYGDSAERLAFRRRLLNANAFFWLAARARLKPASVWAALGVVACLWVWGAVKYPRDWLSPHVYLLTALALNLGTKCWFATEAGRQLAEDRQAGALELLLATPLSVREILQGQRLALQRQFLGPVAIVVAVFLLCIPATFHSQDGPDLLDSEDRAACACLYLAGALMLAADLIALHWVGLWQALATRNPSRASAASFTRLFILPWVAFAVVVLVLDLTSVGNGRDLTWRGRLGLWVGLGLAADIGFGAWARHKLLTRFRQVAEQRYTRRAGFWRRLGTGKESPPGR